MRTIKPVVRIFKSVKVEPEDSAGDGSILLNLYTLGADGTLLKARRVSLGSGQLSMFGHIDTPHLSGGIGGNKADHKVKAPGSRGGKYYETDKGDVRYGKRPEGKKGKVEGENTEEAKAEEAEPSAHVPVKREESLVPVVRIPTDIAGVRKRIAGRRRIGVTVGKKAKAAAEKEAKAEEAKEDKTPKMVTTEIPSSYSSDGIWFKVIESINPGQMKEQKFVGRKINLGSKVDLPVGTLAVHYHDQRKVFWVKLMQLEKNGTWKEIGFDSNRNNWARNLQAEAEKNLPKNTIDSKSSKPVSNETKNSTQGETRKNIFRISHAIEGGQRQKAGNYYEVGMTLKFNSKKPDAPSHVTVTSVNKFHTEDGLSQGYKFEDAWIHEATCRPATPEEIKKYQKESDNQ